MSRWPWALFGTLSTTVYLVIFVMRPIWYDYIVFPFILTLTVLSWINIALNKEDL